MKNARFPDKIGRNSSKSAPQSDNHRQQPHFAATIAYKAALSATSCRHMLTCAPVKAGLGYTALYAAPPQPDQTEARSNADRYGFALLDGRIVYKLQASTTNVSIQIDY